MFDTAMSIKACFLCNLVCDCKVLFTCWLVSQQAQYAKANQNLWFCVQNTRQVNFDYIFEQECCVENWCRRYQTSHSFACHSSGTTTLLMSLSAHEAQHSGHAEQRTGRPGFQAISTWLWHEQAGPSTSTCQCPHKGVTEDGYPHLQHKRAADDGRAAVRHTVHIRVRHYRCLKRAGLPPQKGFWPISAANYRLLARHSVIAHRQVSTCVPCFICAEYRALVFRQNFCKFL